MGEITKDLTEGSVAKQLIRFSAPFLLSNFIQAFYNVADMLIVGWWVGPAGISGVAIGGQVTFLVTALVIGLTVGATILVGQYFGAKQMDNVKETIGTLFTLLLIMGAAFTVIMLIAASTVLRAMDTPAEAFGEALSYLNICMTGTIFIFGYNAISSILRGLGDSKRPLIFVSIACVLNVGLDILFVAGFGMGAAGAAIATVIAQGISLALSVIYLYRQNFIFDFRLKSFGIHTDKLKLIFKLGIPSSIQNLATNISFLFMTTISNSFGLAASSAVGIVGKFNGFAILPAVAMSMSVSSMSAQNIGAQRYDRAKETLKTGIYIALTVGVTIFILVQCMPQAIISFFTNDAQVIEQGVLYLRSFSFDYLIVSFVFCINGLIMGSGHTTFSLVNGMISAVLLRAPLALLLGKVLGMGLRGVGIAAPGASMGALILGIIYYKSGRWMKNKTGINDGQYKKEPS